MQTQFSLRSIMGAFCIAKCSNSCLALQKYIFTYILLNIFAVQKCSTKCLQIHFCIKSVVRTFCEAFLQHNCAKRHALQKVLLCKNKVEHFAYTGAICLRIFFYFYPFSFKEAAFEIASSTLPTR